MIVCPNCSHTNPEGALNCEACYTALPATKACPTCGASIQLDATFCGQCGQNLKPAEQQSPPVTTPMPEPANLDRGLPPTIIASSQLPAVVVNVGSIEPEVESAVIGSPQPDLPITVLPNSEVSQPESSPAKAAVAAETTGSPVATQLQLATHHLLNLQTDKILEIPPHLSVVHLGKPNETSPPDIDVSGLPCSEVVSRIHANIRVEGENYYIEDVGSANGTYINHNSLAKGNRHLLRSGDRISLGKGDLVTFIFQSAEKSD
jgi:ribosomal protein L40E